MVDPPGMSDPVRAEMDPAQLERPGAPSTIIHSTWYRHQALTSHSPPRHFLRRRTPDQPESMQPRGGTQVSLALPSLCCGAAVYTTVAVQHIYSISRLTWCGEWIAAPNIGESLGAQQ